MTQDIPSLDQQETAKATARALIEIEAVRFQTDPPFTLTSGMVSPVYIDCRKIISYPDIRTKLTDFAISVLRHEGVVERTDVIAGGETAGIPFAAWIADRLQMPMVYVRKKPKGFGRKSRIEGDIQAGQRVLLVEDLATDGGSKIGFCEALREAGSRVSDTFVTFFYDIFPHSKQQLASNGIQLHALATWKDVLAECRVAGAFSDQTLDDVEQFLDQPLAWSEARGGQGRSSTDST